MIIQDANLKPIGRDAVRVRLFFIRVLKNLVERAIERIRQLEREFQRRRIFSRFERDDGLTSDSAGFRKFRLRHRRTSEAPFTNAIGDAHARPCAKR